MKFKLIMEKENVILVTGGSGLIGKGIQVVLEDPRYNLKRPNEKWVFASSKDVDLKCYESTEKYFRTVKPNYVIHLAAKVGGLFNNMRNNLQFFVSVYLLIFSLIFLREKIC